MSRVNGTAFVILALTAVATDMAHAGDAGACCLLDLTCVKLPSIICTTVGGEFQGVGTSCATRCLATGACCLPNGPCQEVTEKTCARFDGLYQGDSTQCVFSDPCCPIPGACCIDTTCALVTTELECGAAGGLFLGVGTLCTKLTCGETLGACCLPDGTCLGESAANCAALGGVYLGDDTVCARAGGCAEPLGACCLPDQTCFVDVEPACAVAGGQYQGHGSDCVLPCLPIGGCCFERDRCRVISTAQCDALGGFSLGPDTSCASGCPVIALCCLPDAPADMLPPELCEAIGGTPKFDGCVSLGACSRHFVPGDFATIQLAINRAEDGDEIVVAPGVYAEAVDLRGKTVILRSARGPEMTIIDARGLGQSAVRGVSGKGPDTRIEGFTITGGSSGVGGGMHVAGSSPTIEDCVFVGNDAGTGGGLFVSAGAPLVRGCVFAGNTADDGAGLAVRLSSSVTLEDSGFVGNAAAARGGGVFAGGSSLTISGTTFEANTAASGADVYALLTNLHVDGGLGDDVVNIGHLRPGLDGVGAVVIGDDYTQRLPAGGALGSGDLSIELAGQMPGRSHDVVESTGTVTLGGGLFLALTDGFVPAIGDAFQIMTATARDGAFDVALFPPLPVGRLRLTYGARSVGGASVTVDVAPLINGGELTEPDSTSIGEGEPTDAVVADFDGQDGPDIAALLRGATPQDTGTLIILLNDGTGNGFIVAQTIPVGHGPTAVASGRLDRDDAVDLAVTDEADDTVTVFLNDGAGVFASRPLVIALAPGAAPADVGAADFDDGALSGGALLDDLIVANPGDRTVLMLFNQGSGQFDITQIDVGAGTVLPLSVDPIDLDNDRTFDAIVGSEVDPGGGRLEAPDVLIVLENLGGGAIATRGTFTVGRGLADVLVRDLTQDADGLPEIVVANALDGTLSVLVNEGNLDFAPAVDIVLGDERAPLLPRSLTALDFDLDGDDDLVVVADDPAAGIARLLSLRNDNDVATEQLAFVLPVDQDGNPAARLVVDIDVDVNGVVDLVTFDHGDGGADDGPQTMRSIQLGQPFTIVDLDGDGVVGFTDLLLVLSQWGPCSPDPCAADLDGDGSVGLTDLLTILANWS